LEKKLKKATSQHTLAIIIDLLDPPLITKQSDQPKSGPVNIYQSDSDPRCKALPFVVFRLKTSNS
jgi:hypothetical protein